MKVILYTRDFLRDHWFYVTQLEFQPLFDFWALCSYTWTHLDAFFLPVAELLKGSQRHLQVRHKATAILNEFRCCLRLFQLQSQQHTLKVFPGCLRTPRAWRDECVTH